MGLYLHSSLVMSALIEASMCLSTFQDVLGKDSRSYLSAELFERSKPSPRVLIQSSPSLLPEF